MSAGFPRARADIDQRSGTIAVSLRNLFDEVDRFQMFLASTPDAELEGPPTNYTVTEVAQLKSAFVDLAKLGSIYRGNSAQPTAYDFRTFANLLVGVL